MSRAKSILLLFALTPALAPAPTSGVLTRPQQCLRSAAELAPELPWVRPEIPPPIPETRREREYDIALPASGTLFRAGEPLTPRDRADGLYVYLVVRARGTESLVWGLQAPGENAGEPGKYLTTHSSLLARAAERLGVPAASIEVLGAGQVQILNGEVSRLDNKAGSRRGGPAHLEYAEYVLRSHGLEIPSRRRALTTVREDYSGQGSELQFHAEAEELAQMRHRVDRDPRLAQVRAQLVALQARIYRDFPELRHPTIPGHLDTERLLSRALIDPDRTWPPQDAFDLSQYKGAFRWFQVDGADFATWKIRDFSYERFQALVERGLEAHRRARH